MSPIFTRRLKRFKNNKRAFISLIIFTFLFIVSLFAELIANDKPIIVNYNDKYYFPILFTYSDKEFGGFFDTEADYKDEFTFSEITKNGWAVWPLIQYSYDTIEYNLQSPPPLPPSFDNPLGIDAQGRDVFARLIYGFRLSYNFNYWYYCRSSPGILWWQGRYCRSKVYGNMVRYSYALPAYYDK